MSSLHLAPEKKLVLQDLLKHRQLKTKCAALLLATRKKSGLKSTDLSAAKDLAYDVIVANLEKAINAGWLAERVTWPTVKWALGAGLNVSVVFDTEYVPQAGRAGTLPVRHCGYGVIDVDLHDIRHSDFDGRGSIIGLRFKGSRKLLAQAIARGFVIATS